MKTPGLSLHELVRRLGVRAGGQQPEFADMVMPVALVWDGTPLASVIMPPTGVGGCNMITTATRFAIFEFRSLAPGGAVIEHLTIGTVSVGGIVVKRGVGSAPATIAFTNPGAIANLGPDPVVSTINFGENAAPTIILNSLGTIVTTGTSTFEWAPSLFVPPGFSVTLESASVSAQLQVSITWREVPAQAAA